MGGGGGGGGGGVTCGGLGGQLGHFRFFVSFFFLFFY